jgi:hypothetical protein
VAFFIFQAFCHLVSGQENRRNLAQRLVVCRTTLWSRFLLFFNFVISPARINQIFPLRGHGRWVLGLDGMWLRRFGVVMIYRDITHGVNLWWSWQKSESFQNLVDDFHQVYLLTHQNPPAGVVSDWKGAIVALAEAFFPDVPHQRCLAHLVREGKKLLPKGSPFIFTRELRIIFQEIIFITDPTDYFAWSQKLDNWINCYGGLLKTRSTNPVTKHGWWYTHGNLRRAVGLLTKNQESLFIYLHHPLIPKTNNSLEGVNSQLKRKLGDHRGIPPQQQVNFSFWALVFSRVKTTADLKTLWDNLKKEISGGKNTLI